MTLGDWQRRRSEFNHDWFKPKYLVALQTFLERLQMEDPGSMKRLREFVEIDFPVWGRRAAEAWWLIRHFEQEMSPAGLFQTEPLSRCGAETREWLVPLVHALWLERRQVRESLVRAESLLGRVESGFAALMDCLPGEDDGYLERLQENLPLWRKFADDCVSFSQCLSEFPHTVEVL